MDKVMAKEPEFRATADFGCYIHIYNRTSVDLSLYDSKAEYGFWAKGSPPNVIEPETEVTIHLKDKAGLYGSEGWVVYELYHPKKGTRVTFRVEFCDPFGGSDNYVRASSQKPKLVSCNVLGFQTKGHPFTGHVEIYLADPDAPPGDDNDLQTMADGESQIKIPDVASGIDDGKLHAAYDIGFEGLTKRKPVHEEIAISAFIASKLHFPRGTTYNNLNRKQWEFMRGLVWNDDPSCLLFRNLVDSNSEFELGDAFGIEFAFGSRNSMTQRAHFGDLQFLHGMASEYGENPNTTKARAMAWLEVMYKLAIGEGVTENDRLDQKFPSHFNSSSKPHGGSSLRDLFLGTTTAYNWPDIPRRALGSCLHVIQDSYAVGHTLRRLRNPEDLDSRDRNGYFEFKHGRYAQLGPIITFHTYSGQSGRHAHYDKSKQDRDPKDPSTFNHIIGARDSIEKSIKLMNYYESKTKWEDGVANFFTNEVLALDADATPSNADVDERFGIPETSGTRNLIRPVDTRADQEWQAGLERKMALLEGGFKKTDSGNVAMPSTMRRARLALVPALKWLMVIFALILISVLTQFATRRILL